MYFWEQLEKKVQWIYLPKAKDYEGLELSFFWVSKSWNLDYLYVSAIDNEVIYFREYHSGKVGDDIVPYIRYTDAMKTDSRVFCLPNDVMKLKAINGAWYMIAGATTGE